MDAEDIATFAKGLAMPPEQLKSQHLMQAEEGFTFNAKTCLFLVDNKCSNYDHRPKACASYPHLHKDGFVSRTIGVIDNCSIARLASTYSRD